MSNALSNSKRYVDKRTSGAFKEIGSRRQMEMRQSNGPRGEPIGGHIGTLLNLNLRLFTLALKIVSIVLQLLIMLSFIDLYKK